MSSRYKIQSTEQEISGFFRNKVWADVEGLLRAGIDQAKDELVLLAQNPPVDPSQVTNRGGAVEAMRNMIAFKETMLDEKKRQLQEAADRMEDK